MGTNKSETIELQVQNNGNTEAAPDVILPLLPGVEVTDLGRQIETFSGSNDQANCIFPQSCSNRKQDLWSSCTKPVFWKCRLWMAIVSAFVFIHIVITISLICYSNIYTDEDGYLSLVNGRSQYYNGTLKISEQCINSEVLASNEISQELTERITDVFKTSPALGHYFISAEVDSLSEDNNVATYRLQFTVPSEESNFLRYTMSEEFVGGILRQDVYDQEHTGCQPVLLDPSSITLSLIQ
ncbi:TPA-induced transmembrane protein isoform X2 [Ambystoma mexicanum]|uniref:TPA-induced transmembrane protein isoform X2 n=1 Tax=Ambystoma mexicanum TaxID=8296 RepID=UPI0037E78E92